MCVAIVINYKFSAFIYYSETHWNERVKHPKFGYLVLRLKLPGSFPSNVKLIMDTKQMDMGHIIILT